MSLGRQAVKSLRHLLSDMRAGKPIRQTIVRRVTVRGKAVYARETYKAPIR